MTINLTEEFMKKETELMNLYNEVKLLAEQWDIESLNDLYQLAMMGEGIKYLQHMMCVTMTFYTAIQLMETEKDKFEMQRNLEHEYKNLINYLDFFIQERRLWKSENYRCADWVKRVVDIVVSIKEFFEELPNPESVRAI